MLFREYESTINEWIDKGKDALLVTGARQIGKTFIIRKCLENSSYDYVELNFIERHDLIELFENTKSSEELLLRLSLVSDKPLIKGKTIIFFDEVQECKEIVTQIKFLVENSDFKYIMSGSLLGVELTDLRSAPVGFVRIVDMYPLNFKEFLHALNVQEDTINHLKGCYIERKPVDKFIHEKLLDIFYLYLIVGGMPEAVLEYVETNDLQVVKGVHEKIIRLYKQDFTKYEVKNSLKLKEIYGAMASELDRKNKRFKLNVIENKIRYNRLENDFLWLKEAGVALPVYNISEPKLPLLLSENRRLFKLFFSDVGLLTSQYSDITKMKVLNKDKEINNGSLFENVAAQELFSHQIAVYYYNSKKLGELDFVIEVDGEVVPIEIKSGKDYKKHSALNNVLGIDEYGIKEAFIFSNHNVEVDEKKVYLPVYMIMFVENIKLENSVYKINLQGI